MTFLLAWTLRAAATIALGLLLNLVLRRRSAATRNLVLRATLAVALALPLFATFAPRVEVPLASSLPSNGSSREKGLEYGGATDPVPASPGWSVEADDRARPATYGLVERTPLSSRFVSLPLLILALWLGGTGLLALRWLAGMTKLLLIRRRATPTDAPDVWRAAVPVPATYGRTILLPLESDTWPEARRRAAILHERAHVARRDWPWQTLAALFAALHWPNPLAWLLLRVLRDTAEAAADDAALAHMAPSEYARELLAVAKTVRRVGPALAMARRGGVRDRVVGVLAAGRDRRRPSAHAGVLLIAVIGTCAIAVAGIVRAQRGTVRLLDLTDRSGARWNLAGHRMAGSGTAISGQGFGVPKGDRWVTMRFDLGDSPKTHGIKFEVPPPARTNGYGPIDTVTQPVSLSLIAPEKLRHTDVRIGLAEGDWREIPGSGAFPRSVNRVIGGNAPQYILGVDFPARYRNEQVRIVARLRDGTEPKSIGTGLGYEDAFIRMHGSPEATIQVHGHPAELVRVFIQHRPYRWTTIRNVALRPNPETAAKSRPEIRILTVQAVDVKGEPRKWSEDRRAWSPDGTPLPLAERLPMVDDQFALSGTRRMMLQLRVPRDPRDFAVKVLPWGDRSIAFDLPQKKPSLAALWDIPSNRVREDVRLAVASGPWETYKGDLHFALGHHQKTWLEFDFPKALLGKNLRLIAILKNGRRTAVASFNYGPDGPTAFPTLWNSGRQGWLFDEADDVRNIEIEYRDYDTLVFPRVALRPRTNPWEDPKAGGRLTVRIEKAPRFVGPSKWTLYVHVDERPLAMDRPYRLTGYDAEGRRYLVKDVPAVKGKVWISTNVPLKNPARIIRWTLLSLGKDASRWEYRP